MKIIAAPMYHERVIAAVYLGEATGTLRAHACLHKVKRKARFQVTPVARYVAAHRERVAAKLKTLLGEWARKASAAAMDVVEEFEPSKAAKPSPSQQLMDDVLEALGLDKMSQDIADELEPEMRRAFRTAGVNSMKDILTNVPKELIQSLDEKAVEYAETRGAELVGEAGGEWSITETTRQSLRNLISEGIEEGWSSANLADEIEESFAFSDARADTIARTELAFAHVQGNVEGWRQTGEVDQKRSILGDRHAEQDECDENAEAGPVDFDDDFPSGDDFPPYHPNCVCDVVPVLKSDEEDDVEELAVGDLSKGSPDQARDEHGRWTAGAYSEGGKYAESRERAMNAQELKNHLFAVFNDRLAEVFGGPYNNRYVKAVQAINAHSSSTSNLEANKQTRKYMDRAFKYASVTLDHDGMVYRGMHMSPEVIKKLDDAAGKRGRVYIQQNKQRYVPTTTSLIVAHGFSGYGGAGSVLLKVYLPKGSRVLPIAGMNNFPAEREVTLNRGARFRVVSGQTKQNGGREYTVEYVGSVHNKKSHLGKVEKVEEKTQDRAEHFSSDIEYIEIDGEVVYGTKEDE